MTDRTERASGTTHEGAVELAISGLTCASCAAVIEKRLQRLDGVTASVNYATERATVHTPADYPVDRLVAQVEAAGYHARPVKAPGSARPDDTGERAHGDETDETKALRQRLVGSALLTLPVAAMAMVPALQFDYWQWLSLMLAAPAPRGERGRSTSLRGATSVTARRRWTP